jgi:hypothetical protein
MGHRKVNGKVCAKGSLLGTSSYHSFSMPRVFCDTVKITQPSQNLRDESDITGFLNLPELMISQGFQLPWDHRNASVLPLKLGTFFLNIESGSCNNVYMLMEFQRIIKQMPTKPIVDYFQRV